MYKKKNIIYIVLFTIFSFVHGQYISISTLYKSISPRDISKHLAFYQLYPDTKEGKKALKNAWMLLTQDADNDNTGLSLPKIDIMSIIQIINKKANYTFDKIDEKDLSILEDIAKNLKNRSLKTFGSYDSLDFINSKAEDIDIARGLFLAELGNNAKAKKAIRFYEAAIDLMALQILALLPKDASDIDKINAMNKFIFFDMGFRFPPLSTFSKEIDSYTLLPSVIDKRKGVCLGISILYQCIAQRIGLPLIAKTPPGHIYLSYIQENGEILNIETTARGIHIPCEKYLNLEIKSIPNRNNKDIIGLAFINEASVYLKEGSFDKAAVLYEKAKKYIPEDFQIKQLLGCTYLFIGKKDKAIKLFKEIKDMSPSYYITKDNLAKDYLDKKIDIEGLKAIFKSEEDEREKILLQKDSLEKTSKKFPQFKMGVMLLANNWLKLGRTKEALAILSSHYKYFKNDPIVNFYISALSYERFDYKDAWKYFKKAKKLFLRKNYVPKTIEEFEKALQITSLD